jgi:hypothetical protein
MVSVLVKKQNVWGAGCDSVKMVLIPSSGKIIKPILSSLSSRERNWPNIMDPTHI